MTESISILKGYIEHLEYMKKYADEFFDREQANKDIETFKMTIKALEQKPIIEVLQEIRQEIKTKQTDTEYLQGICPSMDELITKEQAIKQIQKYGVGCFDPDDFIPEQAERFVINKIKAIKPKTGHCKECKYFEYDSVEKVDGIPLPLIVAHEICKKWGNGCKTREDGYCFMFEEQKSEDKE